MTARRALPAAAAVALVLLWTAASFETEASSKDFHCQWAFARLAWRLRARAYDSDLLRAAAAPYLPPHRCEIAYPPPHALLYAPLARLPLRAAAVALDLASVALALACAAAMASATRGAPSRLAIAALVLSFPATYYDLALGQNGMITLAIAVAGWLALVGGRPALAGAVLSLLAYKPQWLAAMAWLPAALGLWRAYAGMAAGLSVVVCGSTIAFGAPMWRAWAAMAAFKASGHGERPEELAMAWDLRNATTLLLPAPWGGTFGYAVMASAVVLGALFLGPDARRDPRSPRAAALLALALLAVPHAQSYDAVLLLLPAVLLLASPARRAAVVCLALMWPALPLMAAGAGVPLLTLAALGLVAAGARARTLGP